MAKEIKMKAEETTPTTAPETGAPENLPAITLSDCANALMAKDENTQALLADIDSITDFAQGVTTINRYAQMGKKVWISTALVIKKALDLAGDDKEAQKLFAQFKKELAYSRAQMYNYRNAGEKMIRQLMDGTLKSIDDLPVNMEHYIRPPKVEKGLAKYVVKGEKGSVHIVTGTYHIYAVVNADNPDDKAYISTNAVCEEGSEIREQVTITEGKSKRVWYNGVTEYEVDGEKKEAPREIQFRKVQFA